MGIEIGRKQLLIFLHANDIVIKSHDIGSTQAQLDALIEWCNKWSILINVNNLRLYKCETTRNSDVPPQRNAVRKL